MNVKTSWKVRFLSIHYQAISLLNLFAIAKTVKYREKKTNLNRRYSQNSASISFSINLVSSWSLKTARRVRLFFLWFLGQGNILIMKREKKVWEIQTWNNSTVTPLRQLASQLIDKARSLWSFFSNCFKCGLWIFID